MKIEDFLKKERISMRSFAKMCNVAHNTIWFIKQGKIPSQITAEKVVQGSKGQVSYEDMGFILHNDMWIRRYGEV